MGKKPWYKRYGCDFIVGTMALTLEERGAYSLVLDLIYDRGGPIPDDARWLAGVCGISLRKWRKIRDRLIDAGKVIEIDGLLHNHRADKELADRDNVKEKQRENPPKTPRKRAEKEADPNQINEVAPSIPEARIQKPESNRENPVSLTGAVADATRPGVSSFFDEFWKCYPKRGGPNPRKPARQAFVAAIEAGHDPPKIIAGLRGYVNDLRKNKQEGTRYVAQAVTWLNECRWEDYQRPSGGTMTDEEQQRLFASLRGTGNGHDAIAA